MKRLLVLLLCCLTLTCYAQQRRVKVTTYKGSVYEGNLEKFKAFEYVIIDTGGRSIMIPYNEMAYIDDVNPVEPTTVVEVPEVSEAPAAIEVPENDKTPIIDETPIAEETPTFEETPTVDEDPMMVETPAEVETLEVTKIAAKSNKNTESKTSAKTSAKAPTKTSAKTTAKAPVKTPEKTPVKTQTKTQAKTQANAPAKSPAKTQAKVQAKATDKTPTKTAEQHRVSTSSKKWVPCSVCSHNPGVCQTCFGVGKTVDGQTCMSCKGSRKCHLCGGQGGHYQAHR